MKPYTVIDNFGQCITIPPQSVRDRAFEYIKPNVKDRELTRLPTPNKGVNYVVDSKKSQARA